MTGTCCSAYSGRIESAASLREPRRGDEAIQIHAGFWAPLCSPGTLRCAPSRGIGFFQWRRRREVIILIAAWLLFAAAAIGALLRS
jgi:hypothetical protein